MVGASLSGWVRSWRGSLLGAVYSWEGSPRGGLLLERLSWEQSAPRNGLLPGTISLEFSRRLFLGNHSQDHTVPRSTLAPELIRIYENVYDKDE
jgi:hypothetical protein